MFEGHPSPPAPRLDPKATATRMEPNLRWLGPVPAGQGGLPELATQKQLTKGKAESDLL